MYQALLRLGWYGKRNDEDELQQGEIITYCCTYLHNTVARTEPAPIRVAVVERMFHVFHMVNQLLDVLLAGD